MSASSSAAGSPTPHEPPAAALRLFIPASACEITSEGVYVSPAVVHHILEALNPTRSPGVGQRPAQGAQRGDVFYSSDAIAYLGLDRLCRPDDALNDLIGNGSLPRRKIRGRLIFSRAELDAVLANGSRTGRRGRPRGSRSKPVASAAG